jgi:septum site-determining protein MinC
MAVEAAAALEAVELKFGQVGVASLALRTDDPDVVRAELARRIAAAPALFARAPLVLDLSRLPALPDRAHTVQLMAAIRAAGMLPDGLAYGTSETSALALELDVPLLAKFRVAPESAGGAAKTPASTAASATAPSQPGLHHAKSVRSGQQVYARGRDLVLTGAVGSGAEVLADGSIHLYARLSGRALAGAQGDTSARIYCQDFQAELISIAGHYRVFEDIPAELRGKAVQAWLEGEKLMLAAL